MTYDNDRRAATWKVPLSDEAQITLNGAAAKISDLNFDDSIVFDFETNHENNVISRISAHRKITKTKKERNES